MSFFAELMAEYWLSQFKDRKEEERGHPSKAIYSYSMHKRVPQIYRFAQTVDNKIRRMAGYPPAPIGAPPEPPGPREADPPWFAYTPRPVKAGLSGVPIAKLSERAFGAEPTLEFYRGYDRMSADVKRDIGDFLEAMDPHIDGYPAERYQGIHEEAKRDVVEEGDASHLWGMALKFNKLEELGEYDLPGGGSEFRPVFQKILGIPTPRQALEMMVFQDEDDPEFVDSGLGLSSDTFISLVWYKIRKHPGVLESVRQELVDTMIRNELTPSRLERMWRDATLLVPLGVPGRKY